MGRITVLKPCPSEIGRSSSSDLEEDYRQCRVDSFIPAAPRILTEKWGRKSCDCCTSSTKDVRAKVFDAVEDRRAHHGSKDGENQGINSVCVTEACEDASRVDNRNEMKGMLTADLDRSAELKQIRLREEQAAALHAEQPDLRLRELHLFSVISSHQQPAYDVIQQALLHDPSSRRSAVSASPRRSPLAPLPPQSRRFRSERS